MWAYVLITNNDIIAIVGPTTKQPQLEILHSLDLGTKDLGIATETDALAENTKSKGASELTQPKHSLANGQGSEHPLSRVINCESAMHPAHAEPTQLHLLTNRRRHLLAKPTSITKFK